MSYRARVERLTDNHHVLPRSGAMRTDVHAFLSPALLAQTDEALWRQAAQAASYPGMIGLYLMPDTHLGYGIPVGGVAVTEDTLIQAGSGYDISCGVVYLRAPELHAADVADPEKRRRWIREVESRIATGVGSHRPRQMPRFSEPHVEEIFRYGARALGVDAHLCERQYIAIDDAALDTDRIGRARDKARPQLGSVGGGNHFVEMQVDRDDGSVWVMIHCGSRGYGWQTANHYFFASAELRGLPKNRREESWLRADEPLGREYWAHHNSAANYAVANRHVIVRGVQQALEDVFWTSGEVFYEISHNLVQEETLLLPDGSTRRGFVHRKGATRAFPPGHPDLVGTQWETTGHPCLVPGSMYQGAAILFPLEGAYGSGCSVNHGAGRVMARGAAKRDLAPIHDAIDAEMASVRRTLGGVEIRGIVGNTPRTPLDECAHVYKDLDAVLGVLEDEGIARVAHRLYPVANIKGTD
ncbi:MAG TPA: RtcB family protein [Pseudolabrys sp.]|nr:RtcB family protein [Pseudolabrys sp.]